MFCLHYGKTKDSIKWPSRLQLIKTKVDSDRYISFFKTLVADTKSSFANKVFTRPQLAYRRSVIMFAVCLY